MHFNQIINQVNDYLIDLIARNQIGTSIRVKKIRHALNIDSKERSKYIQITNYLQKLVHNRDLTFDGKGRYFLTSKGIERFALVEPIIIESIRIEG